MQYSDSSFGEITSNAMIDRKKKHKRKRTKNSEEEDKNEKVKNSKDFRKMLCKNP